MGVALGIMKAVGGKVWEFVRWMFSGNDEHEAKRAILAVLIAISLWGNLTWCPLFRHSPATDPTQPVATAPVTVTVEGQPVTVTVKVTDTKIVYVPAPGGPVTQEWSEHLFPEDVVKVDATGKLSVRHYGFCLRPGIGAAGYLDEFRACVSPALSVRLLHYQRWGLSVVGRWDGQDAWAVGPALDGRLPFLEHVRIGVGWSLIGYRGAMVPGTVDLR